MHSGEDLLVPSLLQPRPDTAHFWERLAHDRGGALTFDQRATVDETVNDLQRRMTHQTYLDDGLTYFRTRGSPGGGLAPPRRGEPSDLDPRSRMI